MPHLAFGSMHSFTSLNQRLTAINILHLRQSTLTFGAAMPGRALSCASPAASSPNPVHVDTHTKFTRVTKIALTAGMSPAAFIPHPVHGRTWGEKA
eukprot:1161540-Pelagomonas_calceolata.AAC.22